ncbi:MAG: DUF6273 domain-containing protein, partial [Eubacteriales bacterium]
EGGNYTSDKLFLLSYPDTINTAYGFSSDYYTEDTARRAQGTDFSKSNGLYVFTDNSYYENGYWWLRSPGGGPNYAGFVNSEGYLSGSYNVDFTRIGARPAFKINLTSEICTSAEGSGCIVDYLNGQIYGLFPGITSLGGSIEVPNGYEISYRIETPNSFGTGTIADITKDGITIESYAIIIYGDVNGDGNIDSIDAGTIVDFENDAVHWNPTADVAYIKAGDLNGDGNIDSMDAGIAVDFENGKIFINQGTGIACSSKITFDSAGGSAVEILIGNTGDEVLAPVNPTKEGYTFVGWEPALPATFPATDLTLTALWVALTNLAVTNISDTDAKIAVTLSPQSLVSTCGFYIGTTEGALTKQMTETINGTISNIWYSLSSDWQPLTPGTKYFYKMYATVGGVECQSAIDSFTTTG